jgi:hypothetical protein
VAPWSSLSLSLCWSSWWSPSRLLLPSWLSASSLLSFITCTHESCHEEDVISAGASIYLASCDVHTHVRTLLPCVVSQHSADFIAGAIVLKPMLNEQMNICL